MSARVPDRVSWPMARVLRCRLAAALGLEPASAAVNPDAIGTDPEAPARCATIEQLANELRIVEPTRVDAALSDAAFILSCNVPRERLPTLSPDVLAAVRTSFGRPVVLQRGEFVSIPSPNADAPAIPSSAVLAAAYLDRIRAFETETLADVDPEGVHQIRVAVRRLRCVLRLLERTTGVQHYRRASEHIRAIGRAASHLRDVDVVGDLVASLRPAPSIRSEISLRFGKRRAVGLQRVRALLTSTRHDQRMAELAGLFVREAASSEGTALGEAAHREIQRELKRLRRVFARGLTDVSSYHDVRRQARRVRDVGDVFAEALRKSDRQWRKRLQPLQATLGRFNDVDVALSMLPVAFRAAAPIRDALERRRSTLLAELGPPMALLAVRLDRTR